MRMITAVQLGMDANPGADRNVKPLSPAAEERRYAPAVQVGERKDYFIEREGLRYAGTHLIVDLWDASHLDDLKRIESAFRDAVTKSGATLLHIHLHHFTPNNGVSGVAVLAESHISIHTWPENGFAAFDVFMCGGADPHRAVEVLQRAFKPGRVEMHEYLRGRME
jgi:S-adenosylmethionine decarboxylase